MGSTASDRGSITLPSTFFVVFILVTTQIPRSPSQGIVHADVGRRGGVPGPGEPQTQEEVGHGQIQLRAGMRTTVFCGNYYRQVR